MKRFPILSFIVILFLLAWQPILAQTKHLINPDPLTEKVFPLMAWDYVDNEKTLKDMSACGINLVAFVRPGFLDACNKYHIRGIIFDEKISGEIFSPYNSKRADPVLRNLIKKYNNHPALYGFHLRDEPQEEEFAELGKSIDLIKKLAPGKWPYVNLFPTHSFGEKYDEHLEKFATICLPTAFSYDNYSSDYKVDGGAHSIFWKNLAQVREASIKHGLPFWNIILTAPHFDYELLTDADLRLRVYGSLVYGAKGLAFYKFISASLPIFAAPDLGNFREGPLDQFGERTPTWSMLQNVNRQVQNIGPTMLKLRSDDVYHIGTIPERTHGPTNQTLVNDVPNGEFIVGDFTHQDGSKYAMIVNKSVIKSYPCRPKFNGSYKTVRLVSSWKGSLQPFTEWYWLAPGQGVLLKLD